jgi:hypothetical protein
MVIEDGNSMGENLTMVFEERMLKNKEAIFSWVLHFSQFAIYRTRASKGDCGEITFNARA